MRLFGFCTFILLFVGAFSASAQDSIMFRGTPTHTGEVSAAIKLPMALSWRYVTGRPISGVTTSYNLSSPIIVGTDTPNPMMYFGSKDVLVAVSTNTGEAKWFYPQTGSIGLQGKTATIRTTPVYYNGFVYVAATDGNLYCINAETGALTWHTQLGGAVNSSPILVDGVLYFGADDGGLYAIDARTGQSIRPPGPIFRASDSIVGSPAYADGMLFFISRDQFAYAVDLAKLLALQPRQSQMRAVKWRYSMSVSAITASPVVANGNVYLVDGANLVCLTANRGRVRWRYQADRAITNTPAVTEQGIFFGTKSDDTVALTPEGRLKWKAKMAASSYASPVVVRLEGVTRQTPTGPQPAYAVVVGSNRGFIYVFDTEAPPGSEEGKLLWNYRIRATTISPSAASTTTAITAGPGQYANVIASPVVVNGAIYALSDDGTLHCFRSDEEDHTPPLVYGELPARGQEMSGAPPIWFAAYILDEGSGIDPDSLDFQLDGETMPDYKYDEYRGLVYYRIAARPKNRNTAAEPVKPLADGRHTVTLKVADWKGNKVEWTWTFIVDNTLPPSKPRVETPSPQ